MRTPFFCCVLAASGFVCGASLAAEELKSGPQIGARLPGPLQAVIVIHAEKPGAGGKKWDFAEQYGQSPVVLVFARTLSDPLVNLVKTLDAEVAKHKTVNKNLRALVVMLSDDGELESTLKDIDQKYRIKDVSLAIDNVAGPPQWNLAQDADVTILLYDRQKIQAKHALRKGELNEKTTESVIAELVKVLGR